VEDLLYLTKCLFSQVTKMNLSYKRNHLNLGLDNIVIQNGQFRVKDFSFSDEREDKYLIFYPL
jgi:hypothetical protein